MKYTKGEWNIYKGSGNDNVWILDNENNTAIAKVTQYKCNTETQNANAQLISASPDMYEVLKAIICDNTKFVVMPDYLADKIQQALAKAEGK